MSITSTKKTETNVVEMEIAVSAEQLKEATENQAEVRVNERGLMVRLYSSLLFEAGSARLTPAALEVLRNVVPLLANIDNYIMIEGHTCDLPLVDTSLFQDNWDLSGARASAVLRYLQQSGIDPERMRTSAFGEYRNILPNNSEANRARNRRVDIVIVSNRSLIIE